jgi:uncharacterized Zn-finger protein
LLAEAFFAGVLWREIEKMLQDIECPYCEAWQEINHDDGYGYQEDEIYEQECNECGKVFTYTTFVTFHYSAEQAPCKNGGGHKLNEICGHPKEFFEYKRRCEYCGEEFIIDQLKHKESCEKYFEELQATKSS